MFLLLCTDFFVTNNTNEWEKKIVRLLIHLCSLQSLNLFACTRWFRTKRNIIENNYDQRCVSVYDILQECERKIKNFTFQWSIDFVRALERPEIPYIRRIKAQHTHTQTNTSNQSNRYCCFFGFSFLFSAHSATLFRRNLCVAVANAQLEYHIVCSWKGIASVSKNNWKKTLWIVWLLARVLATSNSTIPLFAGSVLHCIGI